MVSPKPPVSRNIQKVADSLFSDAVERDAFLRAIQDGQRGITAVAWLTEQPKPGLYEVVSKPAWLPEWIDVVADDARPGKLPEHEAGAFYLLDLSSTFACAPLGEITDKLEVVVDVCAAPGGKGILARRYCNPDLVIGNEVIRKRTAQLISNYKRCSIDPAIVTSCDPAVLGNLLEQTADLVIVDAPCSGQSLVLKDLAAPGAFHPATISMNERRQRRILAHSGRVVAPGGYLLYATCTFSMEENEDNVEWFMKTFPEFSAVEVRSLSPFRSGHTEHFCYRLYPHQGVGAGAFCCLLRRAGSVGERGIALTATSVTDVIRPVWRSAQIPETCDDTRAPRKPANRRRETTKRSSRWSGVKRGFRR
jgi:16S rRNA C967 or C1407 C5-methylase (RsmB/RsmF family)